MSNSIKLPGVARGSDITIAVTVSDTGNAVDLSGRSLVVFDVPPGLRDRVSASISDAATGKITIEIEGSDPIAEGTHMFRLQIKKPDASDLDSIALPVFVLRVH